MLRAIKVFAKLPERRHYLPHARKHLHQRSSLVGFIYAGFAGRVDYSGWIC